LVFFFSLAYGSGGAGGRGGSGGGGGGSGGIVTLFVVLTRGAMVVDWLLCYCSNEWQMWVMWWCEQKFCIFIL
jgi:hypothetical protein